MSAPRPVSVASTVAAVAAPSSPHPARLAMFVRRRSELVPIDDVSSVGTLLRKEKRVVVRIGEAQEEWDLADFVRFVGFDVVPRAQATEYQRSKDLAPVDVPLPSARAAQPHRSGVSEPIRIAFVSSVPGVGKTALMLQFVMRKFVEEYTPTVLEQVRSSIDIQNEVQIVQLLDTGAQQVFESEVFEAASKQDGLLFVIARNDAESFRTLEPLVRQYEKAYGGCLPPSVLIETKSDLPADAAVDRADVSQFRRQHHFETLVTTTAREHDPIDMALKILVRAILNAREREERVRRAELAQPPSASGP